MIVNDETNLLRLITPWLDNNYQIKSKRVTIIFSQTFRELNTPFVGIGGTGKDEEDFLSLFFPRRSKQIRKKLCGHSVFPHLKIDYRLQFVTHWVSGSKEQTTTKLAAVSSLIISLVEN